MPPSAPTAYDLVPYPSHTHAQTHPDRLATMGTLFGMTPAPVERCRVLELGCGDGSNLVPMALGLPESEFVGIDLAERPVRQGQEMIADLGLKNVAIRQGSILEITPDWGSFDYIIAHGLYSWVPAEVRDGLLAICHRHLAPQGIAFVSYLVYPGNHLRNMLREMMLFHVRGLHDPPERTQQATALMQFLAQGMAAQDEYRQLLRVELERILEHDERHLFHDELAEINAPVYFTQFVDHAARHELQYLGEADYFEMVDRPLVPEARQQLQQIGRNRLLREQYLDFLKCRRFRQTLLCHRAVVLPPEPSPAAVASFHIAARTQLVSGPLDLTPAVVARFETAKGGQLETDSALGKAACGALAENWPYALPFADLLGQSRSRLLAAGVTIPDDDAASVLSGFLLQTYGGGFVEFHRHVPQQVRQASDRPVASPIARWQARRGDFVTTLRHQGVRVEDEVGRQLLLLLDGSRDRTALTEELFQFLKARGALTAPEDETTTRAQIAAELEKNLGRLAGLGLLLA